MAFCILRTLLLLSLCIMNSAAAVTVDFSAFADNLKTMAKTGAFVLSWSSKPENVSFKPDATTARRGYALTKTDEGLKLVSGGFVLIVRRGRRVWP